MSKDPVSSFASDETEQSPGISNRESADREQAVRDAHPPVDTSALPPEDAAGRGGEQPIDDNDLQTSHKVGSRSMAQKEADSRYTDRSMPASNKVAGAFGKEPKDSPGKTKQE